MPQFQKTFIYLQKLWKTTYLKKELKNYWEKRDLKKDSCNKCFFCSLKISETFASSLYNILFSFLKSMHPYFQMLRSWKLKCLLFNSQTLKLMLQKSLELHWVLMWLHHATLCLQFAFNMYIIAFSFFLVIKMLTHL